MRADILFFAILGIAAAPAIADSGSCSQQTTRGYWGYTCEGEYPVGQPVRLLGTCTSSKTAFWQCNGSANLSGAFVLPQVLNGQAYNASDCTGTITYTQTLGGEPAPDLHINYVILDQGGAIQGLPTNSGQVLACSLKRITMTAP
ncbi:MAG: hypothetical protein OEX23_12835 [Betaproteobacteria bacterium]|nr:hypothetical protein [Betaproteobacteria bacterium]